MLNKIINLFCEPLIMRRVFGMFKKAPQEKSKVLLITNFE